VLMLWPNDSDQYLGSLTLGAVTVDGAPVQPALESRGLAARLPLATPLAPGQKVEVSAEFSAVANDGAEQGARYGLTNGLLIAPTFYPIIPRIVNGRWQSEWPASEGDVSNSDTAFYAYRLSAPAGMAIAASGVVVDQGTSGDTQTETLLSGPMRDIALAIGDMQLTQRSLPDGIKINAWVLPEHANLGAEMASQGVNQVENLENEVGPYPFAELDIVDTPGTFGGVEYPGLVYIGVVGDSNGFEEATVHEVGHQWFYSLIGDDQLLQPWLDEAAASYTELLYAEKYDGANAVKSYESYFQAEAGSASDPNQPIGLPVDHYQGLDDYAAIVYGKGALFFDTLRHQLGDDTFYKFLHAYYQQYKYGFADSLGFEQVAEATCACDLKPLFEQWVFGK
jgi:aminopeptidase N